MKVTVGGKDYDIEGIIWGTRPAWDLIKHEGKPMTRDEFLTIRNAFLTSAQPIQSPEHLKGRTRALQALQDSLTSPGRHAFIYGYRGVGKSSLRKLRHFSYSIQQERRFWLRVSQHQPSRRYAPT